MLVKKGRRRDEVGRVYLAIQAAIACGRDTVDAGWLMGAMMAEGRLSMAADGERIGAGGLAYFHWLFEVELVSADEADGHHYRFRRRHDGAQITVHLTTANAPRSLRFQQEYERERRRLETKRATLLASGTLVTPTREGRGTSFVRTRSCLQPGARHPDTRNPPRRSPSCTPCTCLCRRCGRRVGLTCKRRPSSGHPCWAAWCAHPRTP